MKMLRRVVAAAVSLVVAAPSNVFAVSLYDGLETRLENPVAPTPLVPGALTAPQLPVGLPGALDASLTLPQISSLPEAAQAARTPLTAAQTASARPLAAAALERASLTASAVPQGSQDGSPPLAADSVFDGSFVAHGVGQYFGTLAASEQPGVVVAKRQGGGASVEVAPTENEMNGNVKSSPKSARERENAAAAMFARGGAASDPAAPTTAKVDLTKYDAVQFQDAGRGKRNVVVVKKGRTDRIVVVGSHNDKVEVGDGVIDNWTGTTMVAHLYQTVKDLPTEATIVFIAHAREEEGLIGSRKFVASLSREELARVDANINLDTLAIKGGGTYDWLNNSDESMLDAADRAVAEENARRAASEQLNLTRARLNGGDADSSSYRDKGVPAVTIFGALEDLIFEIIHTPRDNFGAFSLPIYKETYYVTLALLRYLDRHPVRNPAVS